MEYPSPFSGGGEGLGGVRGGITVPSGSSAFLTLNPTTCTCIWSYQTEFITKESKCQKCYNPCQVQKFLKENSITKLHSCHIKDYNN